MVTRTQLNTLTKQVEHILATVPSARNNDLELQGSLLMTFFPPLERPIYNWMDYVSVMRSVPTLDYIARARRKVVSKRLGLMPTNPEIAQARGFSQEQWKQWATSNHNNFATAPNYPPDIQHKLEQRGMTGLDD